MPFKPKKNVHVDQPHNVTTPELQALLEGINPARACPEQKFTPLLRYYNNRDKNAEEGLAGVRLYVWRTFPRVDNRKTGRRFTNILNLECVSQQDGAPAVTMLPEDLRQFLTEQLGGGRYRVSLNDKSRDPECLAQTAIKIDHIENPPILDPREIDETDQETAQWVTRQLSLGQLARTPHGLVMPNDRSAMPPAAGNGADSKGLADVAMEALRQRNDPTNDYANRKQIDMIADTAERLIEKSKNGGADMDSLLKLAAALKGDNGGGMAAMVPLLITMIQENSKAAERANQQQMQMFTLFLTQRQATAASVEDQNGGVGVVERLLELSTKIAGREKGGGWMDSLKELMPMLLPLLISRMPMPGGGAPNPAAAAMAAAMAQPRMDTGAGMTDQPPAFGPAQIQQMAERAWQCMNRQQDGTDFAAAVEIFYGPATYDAVRALGKPGIVQAMMATSLAPQFQQTAAAFDKFVDEFISFGNPPADSGIPPGGPQTEASAPAGAV
jgi:hypothetical protein